MYDVSAALGRLETGAVSIFQEQSEILYECHLLSIKPGEACVEAARAIK